MKWWKRLASALHTAPHLTVLAAGVAVSTLLFLNVSMAFEQQIAFFLGGLAVSAALAALVRYLVPRETQRVAQSMLEALPNPVYFKGTDGRYSGVNSAWEAFFGIPRSAVIGRTAQELGSRERAVTERLDATDDTLRERPGFQVYEDVISSVDGERHDAIVCQATYVRSADRVAGVLGTIIDITDRKRVERRLGMQHAVTRVLAEAESLHDVVPTIIQTMCETMGWHYGAMYRYYEADVLRCEEMWGVDEPQIRQFMAGVRSRVVIVDGTARGLVRRTLTHGKPVWVSNIAADDTLHRKDLVVKAGLHSAFAFPITAGSEVLGVLEFFHADILQPDVMLLEVAESIGSQVGQYIVRRRAEAEKHLAMHDAVTGLPNRALFMGRLEHAVVQAQRHQRRLAVMFIDLDRFKGVNDTLGHEAGDMLLKEVSRRLKANLRSGDTVARWGGDEFVMLLEDITAEHDMLFIGQKLITELGVASTISGHQVTVTGSIGVSTFPTDAEDASTLLRNADTAMYRAKTKGRSLCELYSGEAAAEWKQEMQADDARSSSALDRSRSALEPAEGALESSGPSARRKGQGLH
ncbi:MAG TPA: diguanylate cyclase [Burkholderiales bacterium]|nr:diguanylate cyclase [Burkholderiales bacterium]